MFSCLPLVGLFKLYFSILRFRCSKAGAGAPFGGLRAASWLTRVSFRSLLEAALGKFSPIFSVLVALAGGAAPLGLPASFERPSMFGKPFLEHFSFSSANMRKYAKTNRVVKNQSSKSIYVALPTL